MAKIMKDELELELELEPEHLPTELLTDMARKDKIVMEQTIELGLEFKFQL